MAKKQPAQQQSVEPDPQFPPGPNPPSDLPDTKSATAGSTDTQAGILTPQAKAPSTTQGEVNSYLDPYVQEMMQLGPEYQHEMDFLKPYLTGTGAGAPETQAQLSAGSVADESPTGSKAVNAADQAMGTALENQQAPGFGALAKAGKEYEGTLPYSDILQTVLGAGKNEILYGTTPNISQINTEQWPDQLKQAYSYLTQAAAGVNSQSGLTAPSVAANQTAPTGSGTGANTTPDGVFTQGSLQSGGNTG